MEKEFASLKSIGLTAFKRLRSRARSGAELFLQTRVTSQFVKEASRCEDIVHNAESGAALRINTSDRSVFRYFSDLKGLPGRIEETLSGPLCVSKKKYIFPRPHVSDIRSSGSYDDKIRSLRINDGRALVSRLVRDPRLNSLPVKDIIHYSYFQTEEYNIVMNTNGLFCSWPETSFGMGIEVLAQKGKRVATAFESQEKRCFARLDPSVMAEKVFFSVSALLRRRAYLKGLSVIVLSPRVGCEFLSIMSPGFYADEVRKGKSVFRGSLGKKIAAPNVTIIDDGTLPEPGGSPFDGEGSPTRRTFIINRGRLSSFMHDSHTASEGSGITTGNSVRGDYREEPRIGSTVFFLEGREGSKKDLIREVRKGLYVIEILGGHTADTVSGDFSMGVSGLMIEDGKFSGSVRSVTIAGNIREFLGSVSMVADDLEFYGAYGCPTIAVNGIRVGG